MTKTAFSINGKKKKVAGKKERDPNACPHRWIIDPPESSVSMGKCSVCGDKKEFQNSLPAEYLQWARNNTITETVSPNYYRSYPEKGVMVDD